MFEIIHFLFEVSIFLTVTYLAVIWRNGLEDLWERKRHICDDDEVTYVEGSGCLIGPGNEKDIDYLILNF
jgi:hypothetical protein